MEGTNFGAPESTARAPPHSPVSVPVGNVTFCILCPVSRVGSVIGKDGNVIEQLKESTESNIWVQKAPPDSAYSIIKIVADVGSMSSVKLGEQEEEVEVSSAQHALIRVFEVVNGFRTAGTVLCRLLTKARYVGSVIGVGGKLIKQMKKETGCNVQTFKGDDLPSCADPDDAMMEIQGNVSAVNKALVSISTRLQACQPIVNTKTAGSRSIDRAFQTSLHRQNEVVPRDALHRTRDVVPREASYRSRQYREVNPRDSLHRHVEISQEDALARYFETFAPDPYQRGIGTITQETLSQPRIDNKRQVVLKILCSNGKASCVIGKGGSTIRDLQSETGVSISVGDTVADCNERLITVTASENLKDGNSPAQRAIVLVFSRLYEVPTENNNITARLVVPSNQIGGLVGKKGQTISEIQKNETFIQVLDVEQNPKCIAENNHQVVQISGEFPNVKEAINHVTSKLLQNLIYHSFDVTSRPVDTDPRIRPQYPFTNRFTPTAIYPPNFGRRSTMDLNDIYHHSSQAPSRSPTPAAPRGVYDGSGGLPSTRTCLGLDSGLKSSNVTNTTVEFRVPENVVFGQNSLQELRRVSGATIIVLEPYRGARDRNRIISISGTPHQIQIAQNMLHAVFSSTLI